MNKKTKFAILGVIALALVTLSLTYAYWLITQTQTKENAITSGCLDISLSNEQNDIALTEQFPISDEEGKKLTPYTFTVTNNCSNSVDYNVNLEVLGDKESNMSSSSIKVMLDDGTPVLVGDKLEVETTNADAYEAHLITQGTLGSKGSATHNVRLWIDENAPISEMNKTFSSKVSVTAGQGIINPIKEGTLAYNLVSRYDGTESITALDSTWVEGEFGESYSYGLPSTTKYYWGTNYTLDSTTGKISLSGTLVQATVAECRAGTVTCGQYTGFSTTTKYPDRYIYEVTSFSSDTADTDTKSYITIKKMPSYNGFSELVPSGEKSLHNTEDDYGVSYYLRGDVTNNYVEFGTYAETQIRGYGSGWLSAYYALYDSLDECNAAADYNQNCSIVYEAGQPIYWRIVRINGDGTIRLIYEGSQPVDNNTTHIASIANSRYNAVNNVGYTYENDDGIQTDSTIKGVVDDWYETNLKTNYEKYLADSLYCNDKSVSATSSNGTTYNGAKRANNISPSLLCTQKDDRYTVNNNIGNKKLSNPIGLATMDELILAGATEIADDTKVTKTYHYLRNSSTLVNTMTPDYSSSSTSGTHEIFAQYKNNLLTMGVSTTSFQDYWYNLYATSVRPVINLKADVEFTGKGTIDSPYLITTN